MQMAQNFIDAINLDSFPSWATCVDFGMDSENQQQVYESYYYPVRNGEITAAQLHNAAFDGPKSETGKRLTELVRNAPSNPHKDVVITTMWDLFENNDDKEDKEQDYFDMEDED